MRMFHMQGVEEAFIPAIGTGNLGYPIDVVAKNMVAETSNYLNKYRLKMKVYFVNYFFYSSISQVIFAVKTVI